MSERAILAAVARADLIAGWALRVLRLAGCVALGVCVGRWMMGRRD